MRLPNKINIESSTSCNSNCVFCPRNLITRPKGNMSDELFHKIIKDGKAMGVYNYSPFFMGEPFVFPKIWEWLDYMEKEKVQVGLYTNGQYIDIDKLSKYKNIRYLDFSINAGTEETYNRVMPKLDFNLVKAKYEEARSKLSCMVRASFVTMEENVNEIELFRKLFRRSEVVSFYNWTGDMHNSIERKGKKKPCWVLFHQMMVLWDGKVVPCCADYNAKQVLGDANKQTLKEIWEGSEWLREKHMKYEFDTPVCSNCNYNCSEEKNG